LSNFTLPLHVVDVLLKKCSYHVNLFIIIIISLPQSTAAISRSGLWWADRLSNCSPFRWIFGYSHPALAIVLRKSSLDLA
jgi:hypothetical protein